MFSRLFKWAVKAALIFVLTTGLLTLSLRWIDPPTSAFMLVRHWQLNSENETIHYNWVNLNQISPHLAMAVIASEDQKFLQHFGFDIAAIKEVLSNHSEGKKMRGASTISQQLAKNLFLWQKRSWVRKGFEVYFTATIELLLPKRRILELYLNVAEFGDRIYGASAAAKHIFATDAQRLTAHQSALLAARLPSPKKYVINPPSQYMLERAEWIKRQVKQLGGIALLQQLTDDE